MPDDAPEVRSLLIQAFNRPDKNYFARDDHELRSQPRMKIDFHNRSINKREGPEYSTVKILNTVDDR